MRLGHPLLPALALAATQTLAQSAQETSPPRPFALGGFELGSDSDDFRSESYNAGGGLYLDPDNRSDRFGYRRSATHYSSPGFSASGDADTVFAVKSLDTADAELSGELTHTHIDVADDLTLGFLQLTARPFEPLGTELRFERNLVDSRASLEQGITYDALTLAGDYQATSRLSFAGVVGRLDFSDGNERRLYRAKANFLLSETYGVSVYVRGRQYSNSDPYNGNYFAPEDFHDWLTGFGVRRRLPWFRATLAANIDWGRQDADGEVAPARTWQVRLESFRGQRWSYALSTGYNATAGAGGGDDYEYRFTTASINWLF